MKRHRAGERRMHLAHFARFAFHLVAQNVRIQARRAGSICCGLQRLLRRGDQVHCVRAAFKTESRVAWLG